MLTAMNTEPTKEERIRHSSMRCTACNATIRIGPNYPIGVPLPRMLELFCPHCHVINLLTNPATEKGDDATNSD